MLVSSLSFFFHGSFGFSIYFARRTDQILSISIWVLWAHEKYLLSVIYLSTKILISPSGVLKLVRQTYTVRVSMLHYRNKNKYENSSFVDSTCSAFWEYVQVPDFPGQSMGFPTPKAPCDWHLCLLNRAHIRFQKVGTPSYIWPMCWVCGPPSCWPRFDLATDRLSGLIFDVSRY